MLKVLIPRLSLKIRIKESRRIKISLKVHWQVALPPYTGYLVLNTTPILTKLRRPGSSLE